MVKHASLAAGAVLLILTLGAVPARPAAPQAAAPDGPSVVSRRCLSCHNGEKKAGGIDFSTRAGARAAGALGPDDPAKNRLVRAVLQGRMPPTGKLPAAEIAALRKWIRSGAVYPRQRLEPLNISDLPLWSLQPVRKPPVPKTKFDGLAKNPVDRFLFVRLQQSGLKPSPPASRLALLRRVTFDLTGLPPAPEDVDAFLNDRSPDAYEKVVDRLLASPAYGERWARHWLDVVRYGESHGYEQNHLRPNAWPYRDYVIRALNEDRPYTQFVTEQLAGDAVGRGKPDVEVATGFLVAGVHDTVGNQTEEGRRQQRANDLDDMVATTAETFLGLTAGCAKCHDHKFDPIPQKDYYRLAAVFAGVRHGERPLGAAEKKTGPEREEDLRRLRFKQGELADLDAEARAAVLRAQGVAPVPRPAVSPRRNVDDFPPVIARYVRFTVLATRDGTEPCLDELELFAPGGAENLALASRGARATASSVLPNYPIHQIAHLNDGRYGNDWSWISRERGEGWAQVELPEPARIGRVVWGRDWNSKFADRLPIRYRIEISEDGRSWKTVATGEDRAPAPEAIPGDRLRAALTPEQKERRESLAREVDELGRRVSADGVSTAYIGTFSAPDPIFLLKRGDVMQRGEPVEPGALSRVPGFPGTLDLSPGSGEAARRLALAKWICDPRNPLTARVLVNRVWHYHFGRGLVGTPSDFGHNGEKPSHPELLDWLAAVFVEPDSSTSFACGWRLKKLHRLLVTSYAYRQSSAADPVGMAKDAGNQLLWRMPLRRLEAEALRDAVLATSGKLDRRMGGPGYRLFEYKVVNVAIYAPLEEHGSETWRRGIYSQPARAIRDPLLGTFDCPESSQRTPRREQTTTALQALALLNGSFTVQQAAFFAERVRKEAGEDRNAQIAHAFRLAFGRAPAPGEKAAAAALAAEHGLPALCRALLNANEFLYY